MQKSLQGYQTKKQVSHDEWLSLVYNTVQLLNFRQKRNKVLFLFLFFCLLHLLYFFIVTGSFSLASLPMFAHCPSFLSLFENKELPVHTSRRSVQIHVWKMKSRLLFKAVIILKWFQVLVDSSCLKHKQTINKHTEQKRYQKHQKFWHFLKKCTLCLFDRSWSFRWMWPPLFPSANGSWTRCTYSIGNCIWMPPSWFKERSEHPGQHSARCFPEFLLWMCYRIGQSMSTMPGWG